LFKGLEACPRNLRNENISPNPKPETRNLYPVYPVDFFLINRGEIHGVNI
jgi:hypothetical protein